MKIFIDRCDLPLGRHLAKSFNQISNVKSADEEPGDQLWKNIQMFSIPSTSKPTFPLPTYNTAPLKSQLDRPNFPGIFPDYVVAIEPSGELQATILDCDLIILSCPQTQNDEFVRPIIDILSQQKEARKNQLVIFISSLITWFKCPLTDSESGLTEDDYRKRKPHPNYKWLLELERQVLKLQPQTATDDTDGPIPETKTIKSYVIASGILYHPYDGLFHEFLKESWYGKDLTCFGPGENVLPMIHLIDLSSIVIKMSQNPPEQRYIVATDDGKSTLFQLLKSISEQLGTGVVRTIKVEDGALDLTFSQFDLDLLKMNLRIDATSAKELAEFAYESGAVDNMQKLLVEYKLVRGLEPATVFIRGPPLIGKTPLAERLCRRYNLTHLEPRKCWEKFVAREVGDDDSMQLIREIKEELESNGKPTDDQLKMILQEQLNNPQSRNQGYVLDGYPESSQEAQLLFGDEDSKIQMPTVIFDLEASEEVLKERINATVTDEMFFKRYEMYKSLESSGEHVLDFFDQRDLHAININCDKLSMNTIEDIMVSRIGKRGYGPSKEQLENEYQKSIEDQRLKEEKEREKKLQLEREAEEKRAKDEVEWQKRLAELKRQEIEILETQSAPLKQYLVTNVMPTLTAALAEVVKVRPADPIDYVAEYLFKHANSVVK